MEDDEDCYGFGALSDMFDDRRGAQTTTTSTHASPAPAEVVKRLDVAAMSRYWWSERKLNDFRRRQREEGDATKEYQHIAAKFDGQRVEGGLGSAFVVEASSQSDKGGLLWIQSQTSDSNAQARRKKEIQDITNRLDLLRTPNGGAKSSAAVYVDMDEIVTAKATTVQHTVKAIKLELRDGSSLELVFMPGPFFDAQHRDEFLKLFAEVQEGRRDSSRSPPTHTGITISATRPSLEDTSTAQATASAPTPTVTEPLNDSHKAMIRQYVQQSETLTESIDIAKKIQAETGYHIGPLSRDGPKFSEDTDYRKKTVERLSKALERMNEDWRVDEQEREERTKARSSKDSDDAFQYRDVTTNEMLSLDAYRHRYLDYIGAHHEHPILRLVPPPPAPRHQTPKHKSSKSKSTEGSTTQLSTFTRIETVSSVVGFDISRSCIIDEDFLHLLRHRSDMMADPTADSDDNKLVADARVALWSTLAGALENYHHVTSQVQKDSLTARHTGKRRSNTRRRSLVQPSVESLESLTSRPTVPNGDGDVFTPGTKRRRARDAESTRRRRRQSLVGNVNFGESEHKQEGTPSLSSRRTSLLRTPGDGTCPLCYDAEAIVEMKPCGHRVCRSCWMRLIRPNASPLVGTVTEDVRQCPWDRESVTQR